MWKLAIDLGSSMTKIYRADTSNGIVLAEPSCVAVAGGSVEQGEERAIKAIGKDAKNLIGKTDREISLIECGKRHDRDVQKLFWEQRSNTQSSSVCSW